MATLTSIQRPSEPNKKKPGESAAYGAGSTARAAMKVAPNVPGLLSEASGVPAFGRELRGAAADFGRGLLGQAPTVAAASTPAAPVQSPVARPQANAVPSMGALPDYLMLGAATNSAPVAAPVVQDAAARIGTPATDGRRVLGSFAGKNGTQTITSDFQAPASGFGVSGMPAGAAPLPDAAPAAARGMARPTLQAPAIGGGSQGAVIGMGPTAEQERLASLTRLDEQIGSMGTLDSRGKRQFASDLLQLRTGLTQQASTLAGRAAETQLDASTRTNLTQLTEQGQNDRAELTANTSADIADMNQRGESARAELVQAGENFRLTNRPEYQADATGVMNRVVNGLARPVADEKGNPLRTVTAQQQKATERRHEVLDSISARAVDSLPVGRNATYEEIQTARAQAAMTNGFQVIVNGAGERMVDIDGQWVPL